MNPTAFALLVCLTVAGALITVLGLIRTTTPPARTRARKSFSRSALAQRLGPRRLVMIAIGLFVGIALATLTGWWIYLLVIPAGAIFIPMLLGNDAESSHITRLDALETWTRSLSGLTSAGSSGLEQVFAASLPSSPTEIRPHITRLVARINARWSTDRALHAFAEELDDPTADLLVTHLLLAAKQRGPGLTAALDSLSEAIFEEVRVRRQIEADRAKPRQNVRIIIIVSAAAFCFLPFAGTFMAPYQTPLGQLLLGVWILVFAGVLVWLKRITVAKPTPRILGHE